MLIHFLIAIVSFVCGGVIGAAIMFNNYRKTSDAKDELGRRFDILSSAYKKLT